MDYSFFINYHVYSISDGKMARLLGNEFPSFEVEFNNIETTQEILRQLSHSKETSTFSLVIVDSKSKANEELDSTWLKDLVTILGHINYYQSNGRKILFLQTEIENVYKRFLEKHFELLGFDRILTVDISLSSVLRDGFFRLEEPTNGLVTASRDYLLNSCSPINYFVSRDGFEYLKKDKTGFEGMLFASLSENEIELIRKIIMLKTQIVESARSNSALIKQVKNKDQYLKLVLNNYSTDGPEVNEMTKIRKFYHFEYEILPLWYKQFGHVIKVFMGKRTLKSLFNDNVKKYKD